MKTIANRLIVFAASAIALGTMAFGQTRMTAEIPFAFYTATGTLPAGTYEFSRHSGAGPEHIVVVREAGTGKVAFAANPLYNEYRKVEGAPIAEFLCGADGCTLKAIRTWDGSLEYAAPRKSKNGERTMAVTTVPLKPLNAD